MVVGLLLFLRRGQADQLLSVLLSLVLMSVVVVLVAVMITRNDYETIQDFLVPPGGDPAVSYKIDGVHAWTWTPSVRKSRTSPSLVHGNSRVGSAFSSTSCFPCDSYRPSWQQRSRREEHPFHRHRHHSGHALFGGSDDASTSSPSHIASTPTTTPETATAATYHHPMAQGTTNSNNDLSDRFPIHSLRKQPPFLALVTQPNACDSDEEFHPALQNLKLAVYTRDVDMVLVRIDQQSTGLKQQQQLQRITVLLQQLMEWSLSSSFVVMLSSTWHLQHPELVENAHGVHFKESHRSHIPTFQHSRPTRSPTVEDTDDNPPPRLLIGTSCHSVQSALQAACSADHPYSVDYFLVGTCYRTASHPEKDVVEGPSLPGKVVQALKETCGDRPLVLAIGGIDETNCDEPITLGADGVAVIRAITQSSHPGNSTRTLKQRMQQAFKERVTKIGRNLN